MNEMIDKLDIAGKIAGMPSGIVVAEITGESADGKSVV